MKILSVQRAAIRFLAAPALLSGLMFGAVTPDSSSVSIPYANSAPLPWTHTVSPCANSILIVGAGQNAGSKLATATYNGVAMTPSITAVNPNTGNGASVWYMVNPPSGAHAVVVTLTGNSGAGVGTDWGTASALSFCGVDPMTPIANAHATSGPTTIHPTNTITPAVAGSVVVEILEITFNTSAIFTPATGWTPPLIPKGGSRAVMTYTGPVAAVATTNTWTLDGNYPYADAMLALTPFAGIVPPPPPPPMTGSFGQGPLSARPPTCAIGQLWLSTDQPTVDLPLNITFCKPLPSAPGTTGVGTMWSDAGTPPIAMLVPVAGTMVNGVCTEAPWFDMTWTPCSKATPVDSIYKGAVVNGLCAVAPAMDCVLPLMMPAGPAPAAAQPVVVPPVIVPAAPAQAGHFDDWLMAFHDAQHTGTSADTVAPPLTVAWTWKDPWPYDSGNGTTMLPIKQFWLPIYSGGRICFQGGLNANRLFCLNAADGSKAYESDNGGYTANGTRLFQFYNYPAVVSGRLLWASTDYLASIDAATGTGYLLSGFLNTNGGFPSGGIAVSNGAAYAQYARTDDTSEQLSYISNPVILTVPGWQRNTPNNVSTFWDLGMLVPAVDGGAVYTNRLCVLEAWNLQLGALWTYGSRNCGSSPAVANGTVYFYASSIGDLVALKAGAVLWSTPIPGGNSPIVSAGMVYVGGIGDTICAAGGFFPICTSTGRMYALDAATGAVKWTFTAGLPFTGLQIPAISGALIYVPGADGILYALDKLTGVEAWRYTGTAAFGPVVVGGGMVYVSDLTETVYGFKPVSASVQL